jgi:hypothetical protein
MSPRGEEAVTTQSRASDAPESLHVVTLERDPLVRIMI